MKRHSESKLALTGILTLGLFGLIFILTGCGQDVEFGSVDTISGKAGIDAGIASSDLPDDESQINDDYFNEDPVDSSNDNLGDADSGDDNNNEGEENNDEVIADESQNDDDQNLEEDVIADSDQNDLENEIIDQLIEDSDRIQCPDDLEEECVMLCHVPPGNHAAAHTIIVGAPAVKAHLNKHHAGDSFDYLGACEDGDVAADLQSLQD